MPNRRSSNDSDELQRTDSGEVLFVQHLKALRPWERGEIATEPVASRSNSKIAFDGERWGNYRILGKAGEGGMGVVYKASEEHLNRNVAIKVIGACASAENVRRFHREASEVAKLRHPNIVGLLTFSKEEEEQPYCVMEFVEGKSLAEHAPMPATEAANCVQILALAMDYAHKKGVVHRDLKPANVMIDEDRVPRIVDFGLAKSADSGFSDPDVLQGTPMYMSPEQATLKEVDERSDIYQLGAILYTLLTQHAPFHHCARNTTAVIEAVRAGTVKPPRQVCPEIPRDLETITMKAMARRPEDRYSSAGAFADDLKRWSGNRPIRARRISFIGRAIRWVRREPKIAALFLGLFLAASAALFYASTARREAILAREQRLRADHNAESAGNYRATAEAKAKEAIEYAEESRDRMSRYLVAAGVTKVEEGNGLAALPWFAEALRVDEQRDDRTAIHRHRIGATLATCPRLVTCWFHEGPARLVHWDSRHERAVSAGDDGVIQVWELPSGRHLSSLKEHSEAIVEWSWGGNSRLTTVDEGGTAIVWDMANLSPIGSLPEKHVTRVAMSPDGERLASVSHHRKVRLWRTGSLSPTGMSFATANDVQSLCFSPPGDKLATGIGSSSQVSPNEARIWDVETGKALVPPLSHVDDVLFVRFSRNGQNLASGSWDGKVRIWNSGTGEPLGDAPLPHESAVSNGVFSISGRRLLTVSEDQSARLWKIPEGTLAIPPLRHAGPVYAAEFSDDEQRLITCGYDGNVRLWDVSTAEPAVSSLPHSGPVLQFATTDDGYLVTCSEDGSVRVWDLRASTDAEQTVRHSNCVARIELSSATGNGLVVSGQKTPGNDHFAQAWNMKTTRPATDRVEHPAMVFEAGWSPDGSLFVTACGDGKARVWSVETDDLYGEVVDHGSPVIDACFHPDGHHIVTAGTDGAAHLWDLQRRATPLISVRHKNALTNVAFSSNGQLFATASRDGTTQIWKIADGTPQGPPCTHAGPVVKIEFDPTCRQLATCSEDGTARLWDTATCELLVPPLRHTAAVRSVAFSPDSSRVATASEDGSARIWSVTNGRALTSALRHDDVVNQVTFSPDSTRLATASGGPRRRRIGELRVWDAWTGEPVSPWLQHDDDVYDCAFDTTGRKLYAVSWDGALKIWNLPFVAQSVGDLTTMTGLLAGSEVDATGGIRAMDAVTFRKAWTTSPGHIRESLKLPLHARKAWYEEQAQASVRRTDWQRLAQLQTRLIEIAPQNANYYSHRADTSIRLGRWADAIDDCTRALETNEHGEADSFPQDKVLSVLHIRAYSLAQMRRFDEAAIDFRDSIRQGLRRPSALSQAALVSLSVGDISFYEECCQLLAETHRIDGKRDVKSVASAWILRDHVEKPTEELSRALVAKAAQFPTQCKWSHLLAGIQCRQLRFTDAEQSLDRVAKMHDGDGSPQDWLFRVMTRIDAGHPDSALQWLRRYRRWLAEMRLPGADPISPFEELKYELLYSEAEEKFEKRFSRLH